MSVTAITYRLRQTIDPPPNHALLNVKSPAGRIIGTVDMSVHPPWTSWFQQLFNAFTEYIVTATVDFGTIPANSFRTELIDTSPLNIGDPQNAFVLPIDPSSAGGLPLGGRMVLTNRLQPIIYNSGPPVTPGALNLQFLILERR